MQEGAHVRENARVRVLTRQAGNLLHAVGWKNGRQTLHEEVFQCRSHGVHWNVEVGNVNVRICTEGEREGAIELVWPVEFISIIKILAPMR